MRPYGDTLGQIGTHWGSHLKLGNGFSVRWRGSSRFKKRTLRQYTSGGTDWFYSLVQTILRMTVQVARGGVRPRLRY